MKVWDRAGIELVTPGFAVGLAIVLRGLVQDYLRFGVGHCTIDTQVPRVTSHRDRCPQVETP